MASEFKCLFIVPLTYVLTFSVDSNVNKDAVIGSILFWQFGEH